MESKPLSHPPLQWWVPEELVLCCLARISRSYYPKLSLVSKRFKYLLISDELKKVREQLKTQEECIYLCLRSPTYPCLNWFGLWINPNHQTSIQRTKNILVRAPSSCSPASLPNAICEMVGSDYYKIGQHSLIFDTKTFTWETLPNPGPEVRFSSNKEMSGNIYVKSKMKNYVYLADEKKCDWHYVAESIFIDNVKCIYKAHKWWYRTKSKERRLIEGLTRLYEYHKYGTRISISGGKLVMFWDSPPWSHDQTTWSHDQTKKIWCAMFVLDKNLNGEVSGQIEWINVVGTVPVSYRLWQCATISS